MKIKEIMRRDIQSLPPEITVKEALSKLLELKISGLPVLDGETRLLGMFTEKDILKHILPSYVEQVGRFVYEENPKSIRKKFAALENLTVRQLMRRDVITVDEDAAACEVARIMLTQRVRRVPVLNKEKKVAGIIAREDIIKFYTQEAGWKIE